MLNRKYKLILYPLLTLLLFVAGIWCLQRTQNLPPEPMNMDSKLADFLKGKTTRYDGYDMRDGGSYNSAVDNAQQR
jgi:hypothetical protein